MEDSVFNALLVVGLIGWVRPLIDRPSQDQLKDVGSQMTSRSYSMGYLTFAVILAFLSIGGLIAMFFHREIFRWAYLAGALGLICATWFFPVAREKPRRDIFFAEVARLIDGAILISAFTI